MNFIPVHSLSTVPLHQRAKGRLDIALAVSGGRTRLARFYQEGCLKARHLKSEGASEVVAINISGGIAGGDAVNTKVELGAGASSVFTTQAAERIYRTLGEASSVMAKFTVGPDAHLAYLPQETILFDGFSLDRTLEIDLTGRASCIGMESLAFGRLAMGEILNSGMLRDRIIIRRDGRLVWRDVARVEGELFAKLDRSGIGGQARVLASLFAVGVDVGALLPRLRDTLGSYIAGISVFDDIILLRMLAPEMVTLRRFVMAALTILRNGALPRVWQN